MRLEIEVEIQNMRACIKGCSEIVQAAREIRWEI